MKSIFLFLFLTAMVSNNIIAQAPSPQPSVLDIKKMTIAVLPYAKSDENVLTKFEESGTLRGAILNVVDKLQKADYINVISFVDQLAKMSDDELNQLEAASDYRKYIADKVSADIIITLDPVWIPNDQMGNQMQVNFSAVESSANTFLASGTAKSIFNRAGQDQLMDKAITGYLDEFLSSMIMGVERLQKNGRPISINVTFEAGSSKDLDTYIDSLDMTIKDLLIECVELKSLDYLSPKSTGALEMNFYNVNIPFVDPSSGKSYKTIKFTQQVEKYLRSKGIQVSTSISDRGTVHVIIK